MTTATTTIPVEVLAWATKFVGGNGSQRRMFDEPLTPDATVRSVLRGLSERFPELQKALWHGTELGAHTEEILAEVGLNTAAIEGLRAAGAISASGSARRAA